MPVVHADALVTYVTSILSAAGVPADEAPIVARLSVAANLAGHDSHGVMLIPKYIRLIEAGEIRPGAQIELLRDTPTATVIDAHMGIGYVVTERAMALTMRKAAEHHVAVTTIRHQSHVGRLAAYPIQAAREGFIAIAMTSSGHMDKTVAPYGGRQGRLNTNPISIAVPSALDGPFVIDMSTSNVAGGRVKLAETQGETIPTGWIVDRDGRPTTDPSEIARGAVLLPLGGPQGYKGYGLSAMVEILSGILVGYGFGADPDAADGTGCFLACFAVEPLYDLATFEREVADFAGYLNSTPPAEGFERVLYPGEQSYRHELERKLHGIEIPTTAWDDLAAMAAKYDVPADDVPTALA